MSDEERAREIADKVRCTPGTVDIRSRVLMWSHLIESALAAARAEGRAEGAAEEREACAAIFDAKLAELDLTKADAISLGWTINEVRFADDANQLIDSAAAIRGRK